MSYADNKGPFPSPRPARTWNHLFIGSEGVFGVIAKATLHVFRVPEERSFSALEFPSFDSGFNAVAECLALGIKPSLVDLSEESDHRVHLYLMHEGFKEGVEAQSRRCLEVCKSYGGRGPWPGPHPGILESAALVGAMVQRGDAGPTQEGPVGTQMASLRLSPHVALPISKVLEYRRICEGILAGERAEGGRIRNLGPAGTLLDAHSPR